MSKTLDCEFKCGSIFTTLCLQPIMGNPFSLPPALALPNEKT